MSNTLALSSTVLRVVTKLNLLMGAFIMALLIASLIAGVPVMRALGVEQRFLTTTLFIGMRLIMVLGICAVPVVHFILTRLLLIVDTVSSGNPFVAANAARLQAIAQHCWRQLMHFPWVVAAAVSSAGVPSISAGLPDAMARRALLFVLARARAGHTCAKT